MTSLIRSAELFTKEGLEELKQLQLDPEFVMSYKGKKVPWGFGTLSYIIYKRTYAREMQESFVAKYAPDMASSSLEEWYLTVARVVNGAQKIGAAYTREEMEEYYDHIFNLRCSPAGRMLWQLGTPTVDKFGMNSLLNCWFAVLNKITSFCFLFENLMLGGGVGFSVKKEHVHELPKVKPGVVVTHEKTNDADFIVPDSRGGWVELLRKVLEAFLVNGKGFSYSTVLVRGKGEKIKGFGGTASGPSILVEGMEKICQVLSARAGKKLRSVDVLDIANIIGSIVVAGNVRRSAEIAIGDSDDPGFLKAKRWDTGTIPNWRAISNNTIEADTFDEIPDLAWEGYNGTGEPYGFFNLALSQTMGRIGDKMTDNVDGLNPCGEVTLMDWECCDLSEQFLNNIADTEQLKRILYLQYKLQKAIINGRFIHEETERVVHKNNRIGMGITGITQVLDKLDSKKIDLDEAYAYMRQVDKQWSKIRKWNPCVKMTTIKPSGTLSFLSGSTPGIHPGFARFCIKNLRMASTDVLYKMCVDAGYKFEYLLNFDGSYDHGTVVGSFPFRFADEAVIASDMSAIRQLELVKKLYRDWADNSISVTVYYRKEELDEVKRWLKENYATSIKSVSFLLHADHNFAQAPLVEIDKNEYDRMVQSARSIDWSSEVGYTSFKDDAECVGGACPIK